MSGAEIGIKDGTRVTKAPVGIFSGNKVTETAQSTGEIVRSREFNKSYQIEIHREQLVPNPLNEKIYNVTENLMELKESILINGLINSLVVHEMRTDGATKYQIVSGERRYRAIMLMSEEEYRAAFPRGIRCNVESAMIDEMSKLMRTVAANRDVRERDPETVAREVEMIMEKLGEEKAAGKEVPKNVADYISRAMNMSVSMVKKYQNYTKIIPELRKETEGNLRVPDIEQLGRMSKDEQIEAVKVLHEKKMSGESQPRLSDKDIKSIKESHADRKTGKYVDENLKIISRYKRILGELGKLYEQYGTEKVKKAVSEKGYCFLEINR